VRPELVRGLLARARETMARFTAVDFIDLIHALCRMSPEVAPANPLTPKPETRNPKPEPRNPKPETRNPHPKP
jgi:hypothetical protein